MANLNQNQPQTVALAANSVATSTVSLQGGQQYRIDLHGVDAAAAAAASFKIYVSGSVRTSLTLGGADLMLGALDSSSAPPGTVYFTPSTTGDYDLDLLSPTAGSFSLGVQSPTLAQTYLIAPQSGNSSSLTATTQHDLIALGTFGSTTGLAPGSATPAAVAVDGGTGFDTLVVSHPVGATLDNTHLSREADGLYLRASYDPLTGPRGLPSNTLTSVNVKLSGIEAVQFYDTTVFTLDAAHADVARLYEGAFGRAPDIGGLAWQLWQLDLGASITQLAHGFLVSPEFNNPAAASLDLFVARIYQNALGRAPEAAGLAYYGGGLANGTLTPETVLIGISDSTEAKAHSASVYFQA